MKGFIKTIIRRVVISAIREGQGEIKQIKRFDASGIVGETIEDREMFQHYGFTSSPQNDAEGIMLGIGNVLYLIAEDDRRYRIAPLQQGEVAIYTDEGDKIHLKRNNIIEITSGSKVTVTAPEVDITASSKVIVSSPDVELGNGSLKKLIDERFKTLYDAHTHLYNPGPGGLTPSDRPAVPLDLSANATAKTKAS